MMKNASILFIVFNALFLSISAMPGRYRQADPVCEAGEASDAHESFQKAEFQAVRWFLVQAARWGTESDMQKAIGRMERYLEKYQQSNDLFIKECEHHGWTLLHWAAKSNTIEVVNVLLSAGACAKALDIKGKAPWQLAPMGSRVRQYLEDASYWPDLD